MPTISVKKRWLDAALEKTYTEEEFDNLCFEFGIELDEITKEAIQNVTEKGKQVSPQTVKVKDEEEILYKIEIPANRYDLLCGEGLAQALRVFLGKQEMPKYTLAKPKSGKCERMIVKKEVTGMRPYVVCAILRGLTIDDETYATLIDLQEKLHHNLCRKRALVAIGVHDLDTIQGPFVYTAMPPEKLKFKPLNQTKEYTAAELMKLYSTDNHLRHYLHIIEHEPLYPVILDARSNVLSMPPIINGDLSKISSKTKNIFIESTATDLTRAKIVLDTLVTTLSQHCTKKFCIEPVEVQQFDGKVTVYPELKYWDMDVSVSEINSKVGFDLDSHQLATLLDRMCLRAKPTSDGQHLRVTVPPTRHDILHACDIVEDAAIAFGYNNLHIDMPATSTVAGQQPLNKLTDLLRAEMAQAGFTEVLTFSLCSRDDIWSKLRKEPDNIAVHIGNPKTIEFQVARTTLLPGILKTISYNKDVPLPLKLFEIQDVVFRDETSDVGAKNERHFCAVFYSKTSGFEVIHELLDRLMELFSVSFGNGIENYYIKAAEDPTFFPGRCAVVYGPGHAELGKLGVLHPEVLTAFELSIPCSVIEINIEPFL